LVSLPYTNAMAMPFHDGRASFEIKELETDRAGRCIEKPTGGVRVFERERGGGWDLSRE